MRHSEEGDIPHWQARLLRAVFMFFFFVISAVAMAVGLAGNAPVFDIAMILAILLGVPISLILAIIFSNRNSLITCACFAFGFYIVFYVATRFFQGNPIIVLLGILAISLSLFLIVPAVRVTRPGVCAKCGYDIRGLLAEKCPECGQPIPQRRS